MAIGIGRRQLITALGSAAAVWPLQARAQQPADRPRRVGVMMAYAEDETEGQLCTAAFREELRKLGWAEGRNVQIDYRWTVGDAALRQRFAKELVSQQPDVILSNNSPTTAAILQQTHTIPIVFALATDPIGDHFVTDLARPGGNVTGFTAMEPTVASKWLELLKEIAPRINKILVLFDPATAPYAGYFLAPIKAAGVAAKTEVIAAPVHEMSDLDAIIISSQGGTDAGLIVMPDSFTTTHSVEITSLAERYRIPSMYPYSFFTKAGGLLSYGIDVADNFRRAAIYVDRILKGTIPSELPVQMPVNYVMTVNRKTAKILGITVPQTLLATADEVIE